MANDLRVKDIVIDGTPAVGENITIKAKITNDGKWYDFYTKAIEIRYYVDGQYIGKDSLPLGLKAGVTNTESISYTVTKEGYQSVQVKIIGATDSNTSNNSRTEGFTGLPALEPDLIVKDIKVIGNPTAGSLVVISTDIQNIGTADYGGLFNPIHLEYYANGEYIGKDKLSWGLGAGKSNNETKFWTPDTSGPHEITVKIVDTSGEKTTSNNERTETFIATEPDLIVKDINVFGGWNKGDEITIDAYVANVGTDDYLNWPLSGDRIKLTYYTWENGEKITIGTDVLEFGLLSGTDNKESIKYTLTESGPHKIEVKVSGAKEGFELDDNNTRAEHFGYDHDSENRKTIGNSADEVKLATWFARSVYGEDKIPQDYRGSQENGRNDDYRSYMDDAGWKVLTGSNLGEHFVPNGNSRFNSGGLYEGRADFLSLWEGQALLAEGTLPDGSKTLMLTFRGTDDRDLGNALTGQAWTGDGLFDYYSSLRPLIDAALSYANDATNGIDKMVVSGHSLGGSTADIFSTVDAHRLKDSVDLTVVAIASAGIDTDVYTHSEFWKGFDGQFNDGVFDLSALPFLTAPDFYIGLSHSEDNVTYPPGGSHLGTLPLVYNFNFDDVLTKLHLPNIDNDSVDSSFGAEHDGGLYWANLSWLTADPLIEQFAGHKVIIGTPDYSRLRDFAGGDFGLFQEYIDLYEDGYYNDTGAKVLDGSHSDDFILGMNGTDMLQGKSGNDLLSGGYDNDTIHGGSGDDKIDAGDGIDWVYGGTGSDWAVLGDGNDRYVDTNDISETSADTVFGGTGNDNIAGGIGNDSLFGGRENDTISGQGGEDSLYGGSGIDSLLGGSGNDMIDAGDGADFVFGGQNADYIVGGGGNDSLNGEGGRDRIMAGKGADTIDGGLGKDNLSGGRGEDVFIFSDNTAKDLIRDFELGVDKLHLDQDLWGGSGKTVGELVVSFGRSHKSGVMLDFDDAGLLILRGLTDFIGLADDIVLV